MLVQTEHLTASHRHGLVDSLDSSEESSNQVIAGVVSRSERGEVCVKQTVNSIAEEQADDGRYSRVLDILEEVSILAGLLAVELG